MANFDLDELYSLPVGSHAYRGGTLWIEDISSRCRPGEEGFYIPPPDHEGGWGGKGKDGRYYNWMPMDAPRSMSSSAVGNK